MIIQYYSTAGFKCVGITVFLSYSNVWDSFNNRPQFGRWLIQQVDSGRYEGLRWLDDQRTTFRIPWKHNSRKDCNDGDNMIFRVWRYALLSANIAPEHCENNLWRYILLMTFNFSPQRHGLSLVVKFRRTRMTRPSGRQIFAARFPASKTSSNSYMTSPKSQLTPIKSISSSLNLITEVSQ